jgi:hypothetical protein
MSAGIYTAERESLHFSLIESKILWYLCRRSAFLVIFFPQRHTANNVRTLTKAKIIRTAGLELTHINMSFHSLHISLPLTALPILKMPAESVTPSLGSHLQERRWDTSLLRRRLLSRLSSLTLNLYGRKAKVKRKDKTKK